MLESLFPPGVVVEVATPAMWEGPLLAGEEQFVATAVAKRRREFTAGRGCARAALARLGVAKAALLADADRVPIWPEGILGSISHTDRLCAVAVGKTAELKGIGLDLELGGPLPDDVAGLVCLPGEVDGLPSVEGLFWEKVVFSAKEAYYKCVFPALRRPLEFEDVRLRLDADRRVFEAAGPVALSGRFAWDAEHVVTGVVWSK